MAVLCVLSGTFDCDRNIPTGDVWQSAAAVLMQLPYITKNLYNFLAFTIKEGFKSFALAAE